MSKVPGRRNFIKNVGIGGVTAALLPLETFSKPGDRSKTKSTRGKFVNQSRSYNSPYKGKNLDRIAFPLGGMGAGMICMEGTGAISHVSVRHKPEIFNEPGMFAAIHIKGIENGAKILEGPVPDWKKFGRKDAGNGSGGDTTGLPHFRNASFEAKFPFGELLISDDDIPLKVKITGWSPFIPTDEDNSSLPVTAFEYEFINTGNTTLQAIFSCNTKNFLKIDKGNNSIREIKNGFILSEAGTEEKRLKTDFAIFSDDNNTVVDHCWFRGGWWDPMTMAWNNVKDGKLQPVPPVQKDAPGASLYVPFTLDAGTQKTVRLFMNWYTPDSELAIGNIGEKCDPASGCCDSPSDLSLDKYDKDFNGKAYKPWYAARFKNIEALADYWLKNYDDLKKNSLLFSDALYASTLPPEVMEAIASNLTILKSPTVMRQYDGRLWNFEGCGHDWGCCHGSCTHVWNYAQAIPHLFPALERSLRHTEFCENQNAAGHQNFRANLPITPATHDFHSAADGQLGGIMKIYREWRISGDNEWLKKMYPMVKRSLDYCINTWDPRHAGAIEEPHHNTYDIEFWGPDGMHNSFYIGALTAIIEMSKFLKKDLSLYQELLKAAKEQMEHELFNGEYFIQKIKVEGLSAKNPATSKSMGGEYSKEAKELLEKEGPKYQYGAGCLADGILGAWIGRMCGLEDEIDQQKISSHLQAVHKYNLKEDLSEHANPQRPSFALGDEGGLLLCTWPKGGKLSLPFVYSDEVWTGIEHQVASHLMMMGHVEEGLEIVRASRNRYDGTIRNPFNEYECGHWYARALSSYGYIQALTGVRYDAVAKSLYVDSKIGDFTSFISTKTGFGAVKYYRGKAEVQSYYGNIEVNKIMIANNS